MGIKGFNNLETTFVTSFVSTVDSTGLDAVTPFQPTPGGIDATGGTIMIILTQLQ